MKKKVARPDALRASAEARLGTMPATIDHAESLLHELQVHQIELEMQNDALREAQLDLQEARDRYVDLYDFAPVGYVTLTIDGRISAINLTGAKLLGAVRNKLRNHVFFPFVAVADRDRWHSRFSLLKNQAGSGAIELALQRHDGSHFPAALTCASQQEGGDVVAIRLAMTDITARRQAERAEREIQHERIATTRRLADIASHLLTVQEDARRRLANDLHDGTSCNLAALAINLDLLTLAAQAKDWQAISAHLADSQALVDDTTASIRAICADLRPPALDHAGLLAALQAYAAIFTQRTGIAITLECPSPAVDLPTDHATLLFRIFQEALTNIGKHAQATAATVELRLDEQPTRLTVTDNGRGIESPPAGTHSGMGLAAMREMAEFAGGSFDIQSGPGGGTRIQATV